MTRPVVPTAPARRRPVDLPSRPDRVFDRLTRGSGLLVLLLLVLIALYLFVQALPAFRYAGWSFFTTVEFRTSSLPPVLGVLGLITGTIVVGVVAVSLAIPVSVLTALFITDYAGRRLRGAMIGLVDLLAAIPSLLYGLWGFSYLSDKMPPVSRFLSDTFSFLPFAHVQPGAQLLSSYFIAGVVVSLMTLPIITSVAREVFAQAPPGEKEAALALGATRWGMLRQVVLPFGKGGIIGGSMLGLGRALGETIAVSLLLPQLPIAGIHLFQYGGATTAGYIASNNGATGLGLAGLLAAGFVLFLFTLGTNVTAAVVIARSRSGSGLDA